MKSYYEDSAVTIYHGDCCEILPELDVKVDLVLTDPPYNVGKDYCDGDKRNDYQEWCQQWFDMMPMPMLFTPGMVNLSMWFQISHPTWVCAWIKPNQCSPSRVGGFNIWEPILVFGKLTKRIPQDAWVMSIGQQVQAEGHPCPKYLPFWKKLVVTCTEEDNTILDPFMGSGTTLRAAKDLGRKAIGIEIEERYCEIAAERMAQEVLDL